jgi:hypothetical protein
MGAIILLAALIAQASPAQPSSTPPPTIVNVQSKNRVCAAIAESIAPSIAGLLQNDHTIVDGVYFLNKWSGDGGTLRAHMDMMHVENDVSGIVRNLSAVNHLLESKEPADTPPAEAQRIEGMKKSLRDVAYQQLMTLNLLDGTLESSQMAEFIDNSSLPNFAAPNMAGFHAAPPSAFAPSGQTGAPELHSWAQAQAGDFFSTLHQTEDAAAVAVVAGSGGCARIDHAVTLPK